MTYIILDLPDPLAISAYYLTLAFPEKKIVLYGEESRDNFEILLLPHYMLPNLQGKSIDVFLNFSSMSEMTPETIKKYLEQIQRAGRKYFIHSNTSRRVSLNIDKMPRSGIVPQGFRLIEKHPNPFRRVEDELYLKMTASEFDYFVYCKQHS